MTAVVGVICKFAIDKWNVVRVTAAIFDGNVASQRVLEKCGFELEGTMKRYFLKDGQFIDSRIYARLNDLSELPF
jgi:RimJ/RimL family protein N-acetyltransferase